MKGKNQATQRSSLRSISLGAALLGLSACSMLNCDNYQSYDDVLNSWVSVDIEEYERSNSGNARSVMERPRNRLEYEYNTPYTNYDGSQEYCKTWMTVDRASGEIVTWRYEGECYRHGRCIG